MAQSPSHKFGQIIGDILEELMHSPLSAVADRHGLYLDYQHARSIRGGKTKVNWTDHRGNCHDLDYVLEHGGSEAVQGTPKAFIETAWRRYTKHSRNKAQEIQGAIGPLGETYSTYNPFLGVVLAGDFTAGSLQQLRSHGFCILYFPYASIQKAFKHVGIDAAFDEETPDAAVRAKISQYESLSTAKRNAITRRLTKLHQAEIDEFITALEMSLNRKPLRVLVATLHGPTLEVDTIAEALEHIKKYDELQPTTGFVRYELHVRYSNGDRITGEFEDKQQAIAFLTGLK